MTEDEISQRANRIMEDLRNDDIDNTDQLQILAGCLAHVVGEALALYGKAGVVPFIEVMEGMMRAIEATMEGMDE